MHELLPATRRLTDECAWRIRLDAEGHCVVMTTTTGRVCTADMTTGERLWEADVLHRYPHLECDQGWMVFDDGEPDELVVWQSARRGVYRRAGVIRTGHVLRAFRLVGARVLVATLDDLLLEYDVRSLAQTHLVHLAGTEHEHGNVTYIDMDDDFFYVAGAGQLSLTVMSRASQRVAMTLRDWMAGYPLTSFVPELLPQPCGAPRFQLRQMHAIRSPIVLESAYQAFRHEPGIEMRQWDAVHPDARTDTLVALSDSGLLFIRHYKAHLLRGSATPELVYYAFPEIVRCAEGRRASRVLSSRHWDGEGQLCVHDGRVVAVSGLMMLVDLCVPMPLTQRPSFTRVPSTADEAPFSVYVWSDVSRALAGCSCVQMDHTGIYVAREHEERGVLSLCMDAPTQLPAARDVPIPALDRLLARYDHDELLVAEPWLWTHWRAFSVGADDAAVETSSAGDSDTDMASVSTSSSETSSEAASETGSETSSETSSEASSETSSETASETGSETGSEAASETSSEASSEAASETGSDSSAETGPEASYASGSTTGSESVTETVTETVTHTGTETITETVTTRVTVTPARRRRR